MSVHIGGMPGTPGARSTGNDILSGGRVQEEQKEKEKLQARNS